MFFIQQILKLLELLHKETGETQLAAGFTLGMFMGFTPLSSLFWAVYVLLLILLRFNFGAAFFAYALFKILSFALDPLFHRLGDALLSAPALHGLWTWAFYVPLVPFTRFNNTIVLGSVVTSLILCVPFFFLSRWAIRKYRVTVVARIKETWVWKAWKATKLFKLYEQYERFAG